MRKFAILWCLLLLGLSSARYMVKRQVVEDESSKSSDTDNLINDKDNAVSDIESGVSENDEGEANGDVNDVSEVEGGDSLEGNYEEEAGGGEEEVADNAQEDEDHGEGGYSQDGNYEEEAGGGEDEVADNSQEDEDHDEGGYSQEGNYEEEAGGGENEVADSAQEDEDHGEGGYSQDGNYEEEADGGENDVSDNAQENKDHGEGIEGGDSDNYIESEEDVSENEVDDIEERIVESDAPQEIEDEGGEGDSNNNLESEIKGDEFEKEGRDVGDVSEEEDDDSEENIDDADVSEVDDGDSVEETADAETHEGDVVQDSEGQEDGNHEEEADGGENDVSDNAQENKDHGEGIEGGDSDNYIESEEDVSENEVDDIEEQIVESDAPQEIEDEGGEGDSNNNLESEIKGDEFENEGRDVGDVSEEEDDDSEENIDDADVSEVDDGDSVEETADAETHEGDVVQDSEGQGVDLNGESDVDATEEETGGDNIDDAQVEGFEGGEDDDSNKNFESEINMAVSEKGAEEDVSESNENQETDDDAREENTDSEDIGVETEGGNTNGKGVIESSNIEDIPSDSAEANEIQSDETGDVYKGPGYQPEAGDVEEAESDELGKEMEDIGDAEDEEQGAPQAIAVGGGIDFLENEEDEDSNESETPEAMEALNEANPEMEADLLTPEEQDTLLKEEERKANIANADGGTEQDGVGVISQAEEEQDDQERDGDRQGQEEEGDGNGENEVANDLLDSLNEYQKLDDEHSEQEQEQEEHNGENGVANGIMDSLNEDSGEKQEAEEKEEGEDQADQKEKQEDQEQDDEQEQGQQEVNGDNDVANDIMDSLNEDDGAEQTDVGVNLQAEEEQQPEDQEQNYEKTEQEQDQKDVNGEIEIEEGRRRRKRDVNTRPPVTSLFPSTAYVKNSFVTVNDAKPVPKSTGRRKRFILPSEYNRWDRGIVPFEFDAVFNTPQSQLERRACMLKYQTQTCIRFVQNDKDTKSKYGLTHNGVMEHVLKGGCWSIQGNSRRHQTVNCCGKPLCLHELGHTLGLVHEHQSSLRKGWIRVNWENIKPAQKRAFVDQMSSPLSSMVGYDITSDMHYNMNTFSVNGKPVMSQLYSGPNLRVKNTDFYAYKEVSLGHKCGETYCASAGFQCVNEGYLTLVRDECVCACPAGLEPASGCADVKKKAVMTQWPRGTYSIFRPENGCPEGLKEGKVVIHSTKSYNSNLWHLGSGYDGTKTEIQVCTSDEDNKSEVPWEPGVYCILRKGGKCPSGFTESFIQYGETTAPETTGAVPDGVFDQQTRLFFCCRSDGFQDLAVRLPNTVPFALVAHSGTCQIIEGMGHQEEFFVVQNKPAAKVDGFGFPTNVERPKVSFNPTYGTIRLAVCYYYPLNIGCGKIIDLDHSNPSATITSPGYPENYPDKTECNWLIKGPEHLTIKIDFDEFQVEGTSTCHDYLEIRQNRMGQAGIKYCGSQLGTTIISVYNNISLTFRSNSAVSKKGFKATVQLIQDEDYVYDPLNKGRTYRGKVNITHAFEPCIPWSQVTHCVHHPLRPGDFEDDLIENYCRNPNDGIMPWCYTATSDCSRNYCDVSKIGKTHNSYDDCDDVIKEDPDFCQRDTAMSGCAVTCSGGGGSAEKEKSYLDVSCPAPEVLEDAEIKSGEKDEYREADVITYKCKTEDLEYKSFCLTDGTWSPVGYVCGGCPYGWAEYKKGCYKYFGTPAKRVAAERICKEHGATLTTVVDQAEEDFVVSIRETMHKIMIGLEKKNGKWVWPDGNVTQWLPWQAPPYDRYDFKYASLLGQDKGRKWVATNGYWPEDFVCKRITKKHVLCKDRLKNCEGIMAILPQSCQNDGWARSECPVSCNLCEVSDKKCAVESAGEGVKQNGTTTSLKIGEYVSYLCDTGYVYKSGSKSRICMRSGKLSGQLLQCQSLNEVPTLSNDVDLRDGQAVGWRNWGHTGMSDSLKIPVSGEIVEWQFYSRTAGEVGFFVFRPTSSPLSMTLVGKNLVKTRFKRKQYAPVKPEDRIKVQVGDVLGLYPKDGVGIPLDWNCAGPGALRLNTYLWNFKSVNVGNEYTFTPEGQCRMWYFKAKIVPTKI